MLYFGGAQADAKGAHRPLTQACYVPGLSVVIVFQIFTHRKRDVIGDVIFCLVLDEFLNFVRLNAGNVRLFQVNTEISSGPLDNAPDWVVLVENCVTVFCDSGINHLFDNIL